MLPSLSGRALCVSDGWGGGEEGGRHVRSDFRPGFPTQTQFKSNTISGPSLTQAWCISDALVRLRAVNLGLLGISDFRV